MGAIQTSELDGSRTDGGGRAMHDAVPMTWQGDGLLLGFWSEGQKVMSRDLTARRRVI